MPLLEVKNLKTFFKTRNGIVKAVNDVTYSIEKGKTLGIVGESGSGKSVSAMSVLRLLDANGYIAEGTISFDGKDLAELTTKELYHIRGNRISVIFQEPMTSLNPVFSIQRQLSEPFMIHQGMNKKQAREKSIEMLRAVQIPNPEAVIRQYPHQLSGGMRQRVMIAMALACKPDILIADEPTHDLGVINEMADDVVVMYCGQVVERAPAKEIFTDCEMSHPYTEGLMFSIPRLNDDRKKLDPIPGVVPHPLDLPKGCKFAPRCKYCTQKCIDEEPQLLPVGETQFVRCFYPKKEERRSEAHGKITVHP